MSNDARSTNPGFQGSETTGCEVTIYRNGYAAGSLERNDGSVTLTGSTNRDSDASIVSVSTVKSMAMPGQLTVVVKTANEKQGGFLEKVQDDDWIDITFTRHAVKYHVMRGLIEEVRRSKTANASGATVTVYTIIGRDFQKIFENTQIWFNMATNENVSGSMALRVFGLPTLAGNVAETTEKMLFGFLREFRKVGRSNWQIPEAMPGAHGTFEDCVKFQTKGYSNFPPRESVSKSFLMPSGSVWDLAKQWSDPMFCELFTEQMPRSSGAAGSGTQRSDISVTAQDTEMTVILRDKPFPVADQKIGSDFGLKSPWFSLPLTIVPRTMVINSDVGVQGYERFNAYFLSPPILQDTSGNIAMQLNKPLWDTEDILLHGLRRYEAQTRYCPKGVDYLDAAKAQRRQLKDWYCLNPIHLNGHLQLGIGQPQIKLGTRLRIPGDTTPDDDETYYVEQVTHSWNLSQGMRTSVGVTRGFRGQDPALVQTIRAVGNRYIVP